MSPRLAAVVPVPVPVPVVVWVAAAFPDAVCEPFEPPHPASIVTAAVAAVAAPSSVRIRMVVPPDGEH